MIGIRGKRNMTHCRVQENAITGSFERTAEYVSNESTQVQCEVSAKHCLKHALEQRRMS